MGVLDRFSLSGLRAVVTGGTGLYGLSFSRALAEAGAEVIVTSRDRSRASAAALALAEEGHTVESLALDLADPADIRRFAAEAGVVDVLVNNAVHREGGGWAETTAEEWAATSAVNSRGLFLVTQAVAAGMSERGSGSIVNIGSIYGLAGPDFAIYEGTDMTMPAFYSYDKAGMVGFTRYLAAALGPRGVRVNCICPGGLASDDQPDSFVAAYSSRVPLGRLAGDDDVTGAVVFLASGAASYLTGAVIPVDGGWTAI